MKSSGGTWPFSINPCNNCKQFVHSQLNHRQNAKFNNNSNIVTPHFIHSSSYNPCLDNISSVSADFDLHRHVSSPSPATPICSAVSSPTTNEDCILDSTHSPNFFFSNGDRTSRSSSSPQHCRTDIDTPQCCNDNIYSVSSSTAREDNSFAIPYRFISSLSSTTETNLILNTLSAARIDENVESMTGALKDQSLNGNHFDLSSPPCTLHAAPFGNNLEHFAENTASMLLPSTNSSPSNTISCQDDQPDIYGMYL